MSTTARTGPAFMAAARRIEPATGALAALLLASGLLLIYAGRHLTFFYDEWTFVLTRRGGGLGTYLDPHNGHLVLFPVLVYKLLLALVGLPHYTPYRVVGVGLHLLCCALVYVIARRRVGGWLALVPVVLLLFMGTAFQVLLWPFQIGYLGSVSGGLGALALIEHDQHRRDGAACALLTWAIISSGVGIAFLVACAVIIVARRDPWRRLWVVAVPGVVFVAWYLGWGQGQQITSDTVLGAPQFVASAAAGATAGIAGLDSAWGPPLVIALVAAIAVAWRRYGAGSPSPMLLAAAAGALTFWTLAAITRADAADPATSRYLYVGAVFISLLVVEARLGVGVRRAWLGLAGVLVLGAVIANVRALRAGERALREDDQIVRAALRVTEIAAPVVSPAFVVDLADAPQLTAGPYLAAERELGSPALTLPELEHAPVGIRARADDFLEHAEQLSLTPARAPITGASPISVTGAHGGHAVGRGMCERLEPADGSGSIDARLPGGAVLLVHAASGPGASVSLRRFASGFSTPPIGHLAGGTSATVRFPADRAPAVPWHVRLTSSRPLEACVS